MFEYIDAGRDHVLYRMEDERATAGVKEGRQERKVSQQVVDRFVAEIRERVIEPHREFFERFYECP